MKPATGRMAVVVPHGVLFRGAAEGKIRHRLIEENLLDTVIGLPEKLFFGTGIPAAILLFKKRKADNTVLFIDASRAYQDGKNQNFLRPEDIRKIVQTCRARASVDKYAYLAQPGRTQRKRLQPQHPALCGYIRGGRRNRPHAGPSRAGTTESRVSRAGSGDGQLSQGVGVRLLRNGPGAGRATTGGCPYIAHSLSPGGRGLGRGRKHGNKDLSRWHNTLRTCIWSIGRRLSTLERLPPGATGRGPLYERPSTSGELRSWTRRRKWSGPGALRKPIRLSAIVSKTMRAIYATCGCKDSRTGQAKVIYIPTEANLPILEAGQKKDRTEEAMESGRERYVVKVTDDPLKEARTSF